MHRSKCLKHHQMSVFRKVAADKTINTSTCTALSGCRNNTTATATASNNNNALKLRHTVTSTTQMFSCNHHSTPNNRITLLKTRSFSKATKAENNIGTTPKMFSTNSCGEFKNYLTASCRKTNSNTTKTSSNTTKTSCIKGTTVLCSGDQNTTTNNKIGLLKLNRRYSESTRTTIASGKRTAILCPGQGTQYIGMFGGDAGFDIIQSSPKLRNMVETSRKILKQDPLELGNKGPSTLQKL